ncbi:hypothetical protein DPEC_G00116970 [Dallia pectoralis]|uniref:Uncharacterized protein n=1 Tax=Dallia pectoralis TaxID=75939 RepID=A0ACC2GV85_DALPE|nr:hypothetical protein DPEC_G00116970 [Dallia pectoralis]
MQCQDPLENGPLLLSSLRLYIPPLRLVSAAMWQVVQQGQVQDYGMLEEFVTTATDVVPELLSFSQRAQLLLGLRARTVLELCRFKQTADQEIQQHLDRIRSLISFGKTESGDAEVEMSESKFVELVESLLRDPREKEHFYQDVFPVEFGPKYDSAIQMLMLEFLTRLETLLPIPDLEQTASMLNAVPSALEQCIQSVPDPRQLRTLLQFHRKSGHLDSIGKEILSPVVKMKRSHIHQLANLCSHHLSSVLLVQSFLRKNLWTPTCALCVRDNERKGQWSGTGMDKALLPSTGHDSLRSIEDRDRSPSHNGGGGEGGSGMSPILNPLSPVKDEDELPILIPTRGFGGVEDVYHPLPPLIPPVGAGGGQYTHSPSPTGGRRDPHRS